MNQLGVVFRFEFLRILKKRSFWVLTLSIPALIAVILGLSVYSSKTTSSADERLKQEKFTLTVMDESGMIRPEVAQSVGAGRVADKTDGIRQVTSGQVDAFFFYPRDPATNKVEVYAKDDGLTKNDKYSSAASALLQASLGMEVGSPQKVQLLQKGPETTLKTYKDGEETKGFGRAVLPGLFLVLFYAIVVLLGNQMLTSTTEEKENRVIEMILTSVKAQTLIVGKFLALSLLGLIQVGAILVPLVVAYAGFREQLHIPNIDPSQLSFAPAPIVLGAAIFLAGYVVFSGMLIAIGSAVPTAKEAGSFFGFAILLMFIPLYALTAVISSPDQLIVKVFTYVPLTAPITLLLRNAAGNLSLHEALLSLAILVVFAVFMMRLAIRTFGYGTLEYSRRLGLREILTRRQ
jgi:ABC-2 type transport system permease protein